MKKRYLLLLSAILAAAALTGCSVSGSGISNYELAGTNNPATVYLSVAYSGNATVSAGSPLVLSLYTNVTGTYPHTNGRYAVYSLPVKQSIITMTNVACSPLYILAHLDSGTVNSNIDAGEQYLGYGSGLSLDSPNEVQVYGGRTNELSLTFADIYRYREATLQLSVNYTGSLSFTNNYKVYVTIATGTNDFMNAGFQTVQATNSSFTTNIYRITATNIYIGAFIDKNGNSGPDAGEPVYIYNGTAAWSNASAVTISTNPSSLHKLTVSFGDTYTNMITNL